MTVYDVPLTEIPWTTWWMLGSAALAFIGFLGWQIGKMVYGAKVIMEKEEGAPRFSWLEEKLLPGYLANQPFKRAAFARSQENRFFRWSFNLMLAGLFLHILFWVYAAIYIAA